MRGTPDDLARSGGASTYHAISAGSLNADTVKAAPGVVVGYYLVNTAVTYRYVKLYNKASNPTVGTDIPRCVFGIPPTSAANVGKGYPITFETGIAIATTVGIADSDATAVVADDLAITLYFL